MKQALQQLAAKLVRLVLGVRGPSAVAPAVVSTGSNSMQPSWEAIGGDRLELASTGFVIQLNHRNCCHPFTLYDPEGRCVAYGSALQRLKDEGAEQARHRAEFGAPLTAAAHLVRGGR
jgi:hypothetical protein